MRDNSPAIMLRPEELFTLQEHLYGVAIDKNAVEAIAKSVEETGHIELIEKLQEATHQELRATLSLYQFI